MYLATVQKKKTTGTGHKLVNYGKGLLAYVFQLGNGTIIMTIHCNTIKPTKLNYVCCAEPRKHIGIVNWEVIELWSHI